MKKHLRRLGYGAAGLLFALLTCALVYVFAVPPKDSIYATSVTCGCGYQEYLAFSGDRSLTWNAGHNRKDEYFRMHPADGGFDLLDWEGKKAAHIVFHRFYLVWQSEGHPAAKIYREFNPVRFILDKREGRNEPYRYETIEAKTAKIIEYQEKKKNEPKQR